MSTLEITIQYKTDSGWPVICEYISPGDLAIFHEGELVLVEDYQQQLIEKLLDPKAYGTVIGKALFRENVRDALLQAIERSQERLRVLLIIEDQELKSIHWERLCAPIGPGDRWNLLLMDPRLLYARFIPSPSSRRFPIFDQSELRMLVVVANPPAENEYGLDPFDASEVVTQIHTALGEDIPQDVLANISGSLGQPTLDNLCTTLASRPYTCLHVVAHGTYGKVKGETALFLINEQGGVERILCTYLLNRLNGLKQPGRIPYFAFLAVCDSAKPEADSILAFGSLAYRLVEEIGMPAVVAMTEKVEIQTAQIISNTFYQSLRRHGQIDLSLAEARDAVFDRVDVTVPALYSRLGARPLFTIADAKLSDREIKHGLDRLADLIPERAPILSQEFTRQTELVRSKLGIDRSSLHDQDVHSWENAYQEIQYICNQITDVEFNALARDKSIPNYDSRCPFPGLQSFGEQDQKFFFGREALIIELVDALNKQKFLPILGPSGCGKSSLVKAGIIPHIKRQESSVEVITITPGMDPISTLDQLVPLDPHPSIILVVDQFEEVFTLCKLHEQRKIFFSRLLSLARQNRLIITMRADFWGDCALYKQLKELMLSNQALISPMTTQELRLAIEKQAAAVDLRFEADLNHEILAAVEDEPSAMPLLQYLLHEMWERRHGRWLLQTEYDKIGGIKQAIAKTADDIYLHRTKEEQRLLQNIFLRLAGPVEGDLSASDRRFTRRRVALTDLIPAGTDPEPARKLMEDLAPRLLMISIDPINQKPMVEVAHEALISSWPRLESWIRSNEAELRTREEIYRAAIRWQQSGKKLGELLTGAPLARALELQNENRDQKALNKEEVEYINRSKQRVMIDRAIGFLSIIVATAIIAVVIVLAATGQINALIYRPIPPQWVTISEGEFTMGSTQEDIDRAGQMENDLPDGAFYDLENEKPAHRVMLSGYEITRFEISNYEYLQCVKAKKCNPPENQNYTDKNLANYPR